MRKTCPAALMQYQVYRWVWAKPGEAAKEILQPNGTWRPTCFRWHPPAGYEWQVLGAM